MNSQAIFEDVKSQFDSLWSTKQRGEVLEVSTPFATTNNKFISVFIEKDKNGDKDDYIISDGGWLAGGEYESYPNKMNCASPTYAKIFNYFKEELLIHPMIVKGMPTYLKSVNRKDLIAGAVHDLAHFLSVVVSAAEIKF